MSRYNLKHVLVVFGCLLFMNGKGQDFSVDSMLNIADNLISDSARYARSMELCGEIWSEHKLGMDIEQKSRLHQLIGYSYTETGRYSKADSMYNLAVGMLENMENPRPPELIEGYNKLAYLYLTQGLTDKALMAIDRGEDIAMTTGDTMNRAFVRNRIQRAIQLNNSFYLSQAQKEVDRAEQLALNLDPIDSILLADIWTTQVATRGMNKEVEQQKERLQEIIEFCRRHPFRSRSPRHRALALLSSLQLLHLFDINGAFETLDEMHQLVKDYYPPTHPLMARTLITLVNTYSYIGDIDQTRIYAEQANYVIDHIPGRKYLKYNNLEFLASSYYRANDYKKAKSYYKQLYRLSRETEKLDPLLDVGSLLNLGWCAVREDSLDKARVLIDSAKAHYDQLKGREHYWTLSSIHEAYGYYYHEKNELTKSIEEYRKALFYTEKNFDRNHFEIGQQYLNLSEVLIPLNKLDSAEVFIDRALDIFNLNESKDTANFNPVSYPFLIPALSIKGKINFKKYLHSLDEDYLNKSMDSYEESIRLIKQLRRYMTSQRTRQKLGEQYFNVFSGALKTAMAIYRLHPNESNLNKIYQLIQSGKAQSLLENFYNSKVIDVADVPSELIEQEKTLQNKIAYLERAIVDKPYFEEKWKAELFEVNIELRDLLIRFKREYPAYYSLKYDNSTVKLSQARNKLEKEQALLEYFMAEDLIYVVVITSDDNEIYEISAHQNLGPIVHRMRRGIADYYLSGNRDSKNFSKYKSEYTGAAFQLYEILLKDLKPLPGELIIIPDGVLGYIPFEALLTEETNTSIDFSKYPYLIRSKHIQYHYSSILLFDDSGANEIGSGLLAVAPAFRDNGYDEIAAVRQGQLLPLVGTIDEVESIGKLFNGVLLTGDEATKSRFSDMAPGFGMIHLATHAVVDDENVNESFLALASQDDSLSDGRLYIRDLYNTSISAELVVLSACETGLGELKRGEGIISLARGFTYAGARSVVTSLWSVSDKATSKLMEYFYQNLKYGKKKHEALRASKLELINDQNGTYAAPFYWAATIAIGDMQPIDDGIGWWRVVIPAFVLIILLLLVAYFRRKW